MKVDEKIVRNLSFMSSEYDGITKFIVSTRNRLHAMNPEEKVDLNEIVRDSEKIKGWITRRLEKELMFFPVWTDWLAEVPGIGASSAAKLIILFNYKFMTICGICGTVVLKKDHTFYCEACEKSIKGDGNLIFRVDEKDFPTISKWWAYMGRHNVDGHMPKRKAGQLANWSTKGRTLSYLISESFVKQTGSLYRAFYDERKRKAEKDHPDLRPFHRNNMAKNETVKLFLAHFWVVSRTLAGKEVTEPYAQTIMGHTNYITPFYWSHTGHETNKTVASHGKHETKFDAAPTKTYKLTKTRGRGKGNGQDGRTEAAV